MRRMIIPSVLVALGTLAVAVAGPAKAEAPSAKTLLDQMTTEPWRYGGLSAKEPERLVIGFHGTGPTSLSGEFAQLDADMRPVTTGSLTGTIASVPPGVAASCAFTVQLPDRTLHFEGTCTPDSLSGDIRTRLRPALLSSQLQNAVSPPLSLNHYWLTTAGFVAALYPTAPTTPQPVTPQ